MYCSVDEVSGHVITSLSLSSTVFRVHGCPGDGHMCRVPAAELGVEAGGAAGDDRHLLTADRGLLHLAVCPLRHRPPQHRVSV